MEARHQPVARAIARLTADAPGRIIDFGCGNGALLARICAVGSVCTPHGIVNPRAISHARRLHPRHAANFRVGDFMRNLDWAAEEYGFGILMPGRLAENDPATVEHFLTALRRSCDRVLFYSYAHDTADGVLGLAARVGFRAAGVCAVAGRHGSCTVTARKCRAGQSVR
jgi:hypothetical protein